MSLRIYIFLFSQALSEAQTMLDRIKQQSYGQSKCIYFSKLSAFGPVYCILYNNQMNAHALSGQSATLLCC